MNIFNIGISGLPQHWASVYRSLDVVELLECATQTFTHKTLNRWRREAPDDFEFVVAADQRIARGTPTSAPFAVTDQSMSWWRQTLATCQRLKASKVLLRTGSAFAPTQASIDRLSTFLDAITKHETRPDIIWEAGGIWSTERLHALCLNHKVVPALDPFVVDELEWVHELPFVYFRLIGTGAALNRFNQPHFERLLTYCTPERPNYCIFASGDPVSNATRFSKFLADVLGEDED